MHKTKQAGSNSSSIAKLQVASGIWTVLPTTSSKPLAPTSACRTIGHRLYCVSFAVAASGVASFGGAVLDLVYSSWLPLPVHGSPYLFAPANRASIFLSAIGSVILALGTSSGQAAVSTWHVDVADWDDAPSLITPAPLLGTLTVADRLVLLLAWNATLSLHTGLQSRLIVQDSGPVVALDCAMADVLPCNDLGTAANVSSRSSLGCFINSNDLAEFTLPPTLRLPGRQVVDFYRGFLVHGAGVLEGSETGTVLHCGYCLRLRFQSVFTLDPRMVVVQGILFPEPLEALRLSTIRYIHIRQCMFRRGIAAFSVWIAQVPNIQFHRCVWQENTGGSVHLELVE